MRAVATAAIALMAMVALAPSASAAPSRPPIRHACCRLAAGAVVKVELVDQVSSAAQKSGDRFRLRLAAPVVVNGMVVLRAGTPGIGKVVESDGPGIGGKAAKMVLAASYLTSPHGRVPLDALQLARPGRDQSRTSQLVGLGGLAFAPLSLVGIVVPGGHVVFRPGSAATAKVATAVTLPPLGRASARDIAAAAAVAASADAALDAEGPIAIPPPPQGQGQVVFFRPKSLLGVGQWFNVREAGAALGKLTNGAYFVHVTSPGVHTYTARLEPELKDHLKLEVDPGETYYVEGALTGGLVLGAADLTPSTRAKFNKAAKDLKPAGPPADDKTAADQTAGIANAEAGRAGADATSQPPPSPVGNTVGTAGGSTVGSLGGNTAGDAPQPRN